MARKYWAQVIDDNDGSSPLMEDVVDNGVATPMLDVVTLLELDSMVEVEGNSCRLDQPQPLEAGDINVVARTDANPSSAELVQIIVEGVVYALDVRSTRLALGGAPILALIAAAPSDGETRAHVNFLLVLTRVEDIRSDFVLPGSHLLLLR